MAFLHHNRGLLAYTLAAVTGVILFYQLPFPASDPLLSLIALERPQLYRVGVWLYTSMLFSSPFIFYSAALSGLYIFSGHSNKPVTVKLPAYPPLAGRKELSVVVGEVHHANTRGPAEAPRWLTIPEPGLYTGIAIFGAIGSGKTTSCMYPFAQQVLAYRAEDKEKRAAGLVLEVKGDFCHQVRDILDKAGRAEDYCEISIGGAFRYNPLHGDLDSYALAYNIASLLNNLFGKGKEPFWQQAYTNLVKFIILLHKCIDDYVTLFDVYECAINPKLLAQKIADGKERLSRFILVATDTFLNHDLDQFTWEKDEHAFAMRSDYSQALEQYLMRNGIQFDLVSKTGTPLTAADQHRLGQFEAVERWFTNDWMSIDSKLRTSIVEGISAFLSLFDDNPHVKYTFCPPKEVYDPVINRDGRFGIPLPSFSTLIERGQVVALNFPVVENPGLARTIGTLLKLDFERAMLGRIPQMGKDPGRFFRPVLFLCDEYQGFATVGESDPTGDEKFFALSRQAKCIPIVATQSISSLRSTLPGESWRTLLQTFRTKIFLTLSDDFSAHTASELCGKEEMFKVNYTISENGQDAKVSLLTGLSTAHKSTVSASKSYNLQRDFVFEAKLFGELHNAEAIVLAYDGSKTHPAQLVYLKPHYLNPNISYFTHRSEGRL